MLPAEAIDGASLTCFKDRYSPGYSHVSNARLAGSPYKQLSVINGQKNCVARRGKVVKKEAEASLSSGEYLVSILYKL